MLTMQITSNDDADCISNLPADIIDTILALIPLRYAVRTSTLSKEWRKKWRSIPSLIFDYHFDKYPLCLHEPEDLIRHVLIQHRGPLNKFAIQIIHFRTVNASLNRLIPLLPSSEIQDFTLHLSSPEFINYGFPFAFQNLMHLNLHGCFFGPPRNFEGYQRLITLNFQEVEFNPAAFLRFISRCLLLERVRLVQCTRIDLLEIEGPCLRAFTFHGSFKFIRFKNSPLLSEVSLAIPFRGNGEYQLYNLEGLKFFHFPPSLEKLYLHPHVLMILHGGRRTNSPQSFNSLKLLDLSMTLESYVEVECALLLARISPQLQMLRISVYAPSSKGRVMEFIRAQERHHYVYHIRKISIVGFTGISVEIAFVRYLLASTAGLEEFSVQPVFADQASVTWLRNLLRNLPRASPDAQLIIVIY